VIRWRSDVSSYPGLDGQTQFGPTYVHEYSTRSAYGSNIAWGVDDPLNATWWHLVTERESRSVCSLRTSVLTRFLPEMELNLDLVAVRDSPHLQPLVVGQLMFSLSRRSLISRANNRFARAVAPGVASPQRYVICVAARRALPTRIVRVALDPIRLVARTNRLLSVEFCVVFVVGFFLDVVV